MQLKTWSRILFSLALPALAIPACVANDDEAEPIEEAEVAADEPTSSALVSPGASGFVPADYDGDGKADQGWVVPGTGVYKIDKDDDPYWDQDLRYPASGDWRFIVPADYDGDGKADIAIKDRFGKWNIDYARNGFSGTWDESWAGYGAASIPAPADYDGDGRADLSVKDSGGTWYINYASNGFASGWDVSYSGYGPDSAVPVPADYDGDGRADLSVKDSGGTWYINYASNGFASGWDASYAGYGGSTARPAPADYDGDRRADLSVKDTTGTWYVNYASNGFASGWDASFTARGWATIPLPGDYDGDGKADLSVAVAGDYWYVDYSANGFGPWDLSDRIDDVSQATITLEDATTSSLRVRFDGDSVTDEIISVMDSANNYRTVQGRTDTRTFSSLTPGTQYCFQMWAQNSESVNQSNKCFSTKTPSTPPPTTGTYSVALNMQPIVGPLYYTGSWGPVADTIATRLWRADEGLYITSYILFLKPGYTNADCYNNPQATIPLIDGGSLDEAQIAQLQGTTFPPGNRYNFRACYTSTGVSDPSSIRFNLDWRKVQ